MGRPFVVTPTIRKKSSPLVSRVVHNLDGLIVNTVTLTRPAPAEPVVIDLT